MKKTYIQPSVKAITMKVTQFMMNSMLVDPSEETTIQLSRDADFGDEEFEDDFDMDEEEI